MRVLNLSLDSRINEAGSPVARRLAALSVAVGEVAALAPKGDNKVREFLRIWREAEALLCEKKYDLITVQDTAYLALLAYLLARRFCVPLEMQVHGLEKFYGIRKLLTGFLLKRADKIRVVSERLRREISARAYVLPVYTQIETPTSHTKQTRETFTFLTVGRLVPVKNIGLQIRAFTQIVKESPHTRLVIVGDGSERENLPKHDRVIFEGQQKDLRRFYEEADAFLLTSNSEGWGVVVTEAAAYGLPIVMTDVGCAGEFIKDGENGTVIPVGDEEALVSAMKKLITNADFRTRLGEKAYLAYLALPSKERQVQKQVEAWASFK